jgi:hypothetical protein
MSSPTHNPHCFLLDLPVETLQRITGLLDPHKDLPILRRTCKTLDDVTFDQFANASFSNIKCCIFSEARWLRLNEILGGPKRVTSKIRDVEFTTFMFDRREKSEIELLLNDDFFDEPMGRVRQANNARDHEKAKAAEIQHLPNLALMSHALRDVQAVLPPQAVTFDLIQNLYEPSIYLQAHFEAFLTLSFIQPLLRVGGLALNQDAIWGLLRNFDHLSQDMLRCTSELQTFKLGTGRGDHDYERADRDKPLDHIYEILRSAKELRVQHLDLRMFQRWDAAAPTARRLFESTISCGLAHLTLSHMWVDEKALLESLSRHAPNLLSLSLRTITLLDTQDGWLACLRALSKMPRLSYLKIRTLIEWPADLDKTIFVKLSSEAGDTYKPWYFREYDGAEVVSSVLEELIAGPVIYVDCQGNYLGQRSSDGHLHLV